MMPRLGVHDDLKEAILVLEQERKIAIDEKENATNAKERTAREVQYQQNYFTT